MVEDDILFTNPLAGKGLSLIVVRHAHMEGGNLDLAFGRTEQRNYIRMGLSTPGASHFALYLSS